MAPDWVSVNNLAMQTVKFVYPFIVDIGCFSHTLDHVGDHFNTPNLKEVLHLWISLFSHSPGLVEITSRPKHGGLLTHKVVE